MFGIDWIQWRALVITALRIAFRSSGGGLPRHSGMGTAAALISIVLFHGIVGVTFAVLIYWTTDLLFGTSLFLTYVSFAVLLSILLDYHSAVTSPDDYGVLGYRPISSRTYFAARLTNLFLFTGVISGALGLPPLAAFALRGGLVSAAAAAAATAGTAFATALGTVVVYAWLVTHVSSARLSRVLTYMQVVMSIGAYGSFALIPALLERGRSIDFELPRTAWLHLHPAIWFARYVELAEGRIGVEQLAPAAASLALAVALVALAAGRLSLQYAARLGEISVAAAPAAPAKAVKVGRRWWFGRDEDRAVAVLVGAQFRHDPKFRLAVLAILPVTVFYLLMGLRDRTLTDPFSSDALDHPALLYYGVLLFPIMLHMSLTRSDSYQAAWIFYVSPVSLPRLVGAMKDYLLTHIVVPYLAVLAAVFAWYYDAWWHVVVHSLVLLLFSHAMLIFTVMLDPELPFARPLKRGEGTAYLIVTFMVASVIGVGVIPFAGQFMYVSAARIAILLAALVLLNAVMDAGLRRRLQRLADRAEFVG